MSVAGLGVCLPETIVGNDHWASALDTTDAWIRSRTGIANRHVAAPEQATSDLAIVAARAALADAGIDARDLGAVVLATTTPDQVMPGSAPLVAAALGSDAPAFDLHAACTGFVYGLRVAGALALDGSPVLLIGADTLTRIVDPHDRGTAVLFGDGAGAVVLTADAEGELGPFDLGSDGSLGAILDVPAGGSRLPASAGTVAAGAHHLRMAGAEVYRNAVAHMTESSQAVLDAAGVTVDDIDLLVGHQANVRILDAVAGRIGIPVERCQISITEHGNTSAASIPLALADARTAGKLPDGARLLLTAFGSGLTWGSCLLTWKDRA